MSQLPPYKPIQFSSACSSCSPSELNSFCSSNGGHPNLSRGLFLRLTATCVQFRRQSALLICRHLPRECLTTADYRWPCSKPDQSPLKHAKLNQDRLTLCAQVP
ncbi:MAG: hypothetical protein QOJ42_273 [Acidobacteriaceae bacterium]|nr:hypothetical protein [Acidobacteriaceae bacterium]